MEDSRGWYWAAYKGVSMTMEILVGDWVTYKWNGMNYIGKVYSKDSKGFTLEIYDGGGIGLIYRQVLKEDIVSVETNKKVNKDMGKNTCQICGGETVDDKVSRLCLCDLEKDNVNKDMVNHPKHYTFGKIEVITVIDDWQLGFYEGQVIKYVGRANHKGNELEDLKKAQWYLNRLIEQKEK
jgi:Protein of unknwon function (DUF3310)